MFLRLRYCSATLAALVGLTPLTAADREPSAADIAKLVAQAAKDKPDWWDTVQLNYPQTLDLTCPKSPNGKWTPKLIPGQWHHDVIKPNNKRWQEGTKFWHMVLANAKQNNLPEAERQAAISLGHCYSDLLQDWPRALYWLQQADAREPNQAERQVQIAHAYWNLGSRTLAVKVMKTMPQDVTRHGSLIKLWADLGDYQTAYRLAEQKVQSAQDVGWLMAGYTAQLEGDWTKAVTFFTKVDSAAQNKSGRDWKQSRARAAAAVTAITLFETLDLAKIPDGTYQDESPGYSGPVHVEVKVADHRITSVRVTKHQEKEYYASLTEMPAKIIAKQHVKQVDATLGATLTAEAIVYATAKALHQGRG